MPPAAPGSRPAAWRDEGPLATGHARPNISGAMPNPVAARRRCPKVSAEDATMNHLRTAVLLAGLTALFMGIGYLIGGGSGARIALLAPGGVQLRTQRT